MIENILELLKNELKGPILAQVAQALGLSDEKAKSSLEAAISAILAGVLQKASRPGGGESLVKTLKEGSYDGNLLHNLGSVLATGDGAQGLMRTGNSLLDGLFGDKLASVAGALATDLGLSKGPASSLLALAAPLVMSQIGKMAAAKGFNASALTDMLMSQKSHLLSAGASGPGRCLGRPEQSGRDAARQDGRAAQGGGIRLGGGPDRCSQRRNDVRLDTVGLARWATCRASDCDWHLCVASERCRQSGRTSGGGGRGGEGSR